MSKQDIEQLLNQKQETFHNKLFNNLIQKIKEKDFHYSSKLENVILLILASQYNHQDKVKALNQQLGIDFGVFSESTSTEEEDDMPVQQVKKMIVVPQQIKKKYYLDGGRLNVLEGLEQISNYIQKTTGVQISENHILIKESDNRYRQFIAGSLQKPITGIDELKFDKNEYETYQLDIKHCYGTIQVNNKYYDINIQRMKVQ